MSIANLYEICIPYHNLHQQVDQVFSNFGHNQDLCYNSTQRKGKGIEKDLSNNSKAHGTMLFRSWSISKMQMHAFAILVKCLRKIPQMKKH